MADITVKELLDVGNKLRKRGDKNLQVLDDIIPGIRANFSTEVGYNILKEDMNQYGFLLTKIINETATPQELAEFRVIKGRLYSISRKLDTYLALSGKVGGK